MKKARNATHKSIKKQAKAKKKAAGKLFRDDIKLSDFKDKKDEKAPKKTRYQTATKNLQNWLVNNPKADEKQKQMFLSVTLSDFFPEFSFVGFYDAKPGDN